jgi:hypothetical protein
MADYSFVTEWKLKAPLEAVWSTILDSKAWPSWWKGVVSVSEIHPAMTAASAIFPILPGGVFCPIRLHFAPPS